MRNSTGIQRDPLTTKGLAKLVIVTQWELQARFATRRQVNALAKMVSRVANAIDVRKAINRGVLPSLLVSKSPGQIPSP